jgi:hypothetical protein
MDMTTVNCPCLGDPCDPEGCNPEEQKTLDCDFAIMEAKSYATKVRTRKESRYLMIGGIILIVVVAIIGSIIHFL